MSDHPETYMSHTGEVRPWKRARRPGEVSCYDCGLPYASLPFGDLSIPSECWEKINPSIHKGGGLLCPNCMFERLAVIDCMGIRDAKIWPSINSVPSIGDSDE